jgi:thiol-disulfide isomerase/thioredoxin
MNKRREALILGAAGLAATAAGFLAGPALLRLGSDDTGAKPLFASKFADLDGKIRQMDEWKSMLLLCNFWATWCAPCREEIPLLMDARAKYAPSGFEVVGIAIDNVDKVRQYAASMKISYPVLVAEAEGLELMRQLGNSGGGLPYTVLADRGGAIVRRKLGALKAPELDDILAPFARA